MNKRIHALMEQAMELVDPYALEGEFGPRQLNEVKFAELIVQECAETVQDFVDHRFPASEYPNRLKRYFGVEK